jgi:hypothetical protein
MNCKPNDRAVIVFDECSENIGAFVTVRALDPLSGLYYSNCWTFDEASRPLRHLCVMTKQQLKPPFRSSFENGGHALIPDSWLIPIRGDGITDEEVRDLYAPKQTEPA